MNINDNNIKLQEKIDFYILGRMAPEEKANFEFELTNNMELRKKYELQKEISDAVQKARMKELLVSIENDIIETRSIQMNIKKKWIMLTSSIAASILIIFFIGFEFHQTSAYKTYGNECYAEIVAPSSRSNNKLDSLMFSIHTQIGEGNYSLAKANIEGAEAIISALKETKYDSEEEQKYYDDIMSIKTQEIDWYDAVLKMKQGKYRKAKKELKKIANGNGIYSEKAEEILNR